MGKYFGTDGFRGKAGVVLTAQHAFQTGRFLGWYYSKKHLDDKAKIVIGKDTRRSSYMYESALSAGITSSGADAYLLHVTTTPCVSYITRTENFDCGVMISASHNPYYDNGIKLLNGKGEKMDDDLQDSLEKYIDGETEELPFASEDKIGCTVDFYTGRNRYIGYLTNLATRPFDDHKVALDCSNGSSWMIGPAVFNALGAKTYVIHNKPDGVNINRDCGSTHIESLKNYVRENNLDVGFAFDGDADRCLAVDENGEEVNRAADLVFICERKFFGLPVDIFFNLVLQVVIHFLALVVHQLDSVVIIRIMAGGNHNAAVKTLSPCDIADAGGGRHMQEVNIRTGRGNAGCKRIFIHIGRTPRILADHNPGFVVKMFFAVIPTEKTTGFECVVGGQNDAGLSPEAIRSKVFSHKAPPLILDHKGSETSKSRCIITS